MSISQNMWDSEIEIPEAWFLGSMKTTNTQYGNAYSKEQLHGKSEHRQFTAWHKVRRNQLCEDYCSSEQTEHYHLHFTKLLREINDNTLLLKLKKSPSFTNWNDCRFWKTNIYELLIIISDNTYPHVSGYFWIRNFFFRIRLPSTRIRRIR